jgi:hypothetical protein
MKNVLEESEKVNILVTGDFIRDYNLIKQPINPTGYRDSLSSTVMEDQPGGAWYLAEMIKLVHDGLLTDVIIPEYPGRKEMLQFKINQAFQVWRKCEEAKDDKKISIWRVENFLGCEKFNKNEKEAIKPLSDHLVFNEGINIANGMLVVDDVSLGFVDDNDIVDALMTEAHKVKNIILKTHSSHFNSLLWKRFVKEDLLKKTTVVITADSLREGGAYITRGFSWDKTIEETVKEFDSGSFSVVLGDCKRVIVLFDKFGIASFTNESLQSKFKGTDIQATKLTFERFVYDRQNYEGVWDKRYNGSIYGSLSILTAAVTLLYSNVRFSTSYIYNLALNCIHKNIEFGGGKGKSPDFSEIYLYIKNVFSLDKSTFDNQSDDFKKCRNELVKSVYKFYSAYPRYNTSCNYGLKRNGNEFQSNLLSDVAGYGEDFLFSKAIEIIMRGPEDALKAVPMAKFGKYQTYDREEIERINSVQNLIRVYLSHPSDNRPLSFAVFGAPGSGKSFAIKQLLESIFGNSNEPMTFNLTQIKDIHDLHQALHIVRDRTVKGAIPLVFWDEFDCESNRWLKEFLAPMQDGEFSEGSYIHPLGRAIFVFAGGTSSTFEEYEHKVLPEKDLKGPDFISRLRGFVNIKGPNNIYDSTKSDIYIKSNNSEKISEGDDAYLIRRAIIIRTNLKKHHTPIFENNEVPSISPGVVNALLKTKEYLHGARSMESIISLSRTGNNKHFDTSSLPSPELLRIHTSNDFTSLVHEGELEYSLIEILAEVVHNQWKTEKENQEGKDNKPSYIYGESRNDGPEKYTHPRLMDYQKLKEEWKEDNRITARLTKAKFLSIGYQIIPPRLQNNSDLEIDKVIELHRNELIEMEHDIWIRSHLIDGYEYCAETNDAMLLHKDIAKLSDMESVEIHLDNAIINATMDVLRKHNFKLRAV